VRAAVCPAPPRVACRLTVGGVLQGGGNLSGLTLRRLEELGGVAGIVEGAGPLGKVGVVEHLARIRGPPGPDLSHNLTVSEKICDVPGGPAWVAARLIAGDRG